MPDPNEAVSVTPSSPTPWIEFVEPNVVQSVVPASAAGTVAFSTCSFSENQSALRAEDLPSVHRDGPRNPSLPKETSSTARKHRSPGVAEHTVEYADEAVTASPPNRVANRAAPVEKQNRESEIEVVLVVHLT